LFIDTITNRIVKTLYLVTTDFAYGFLNNDLFVV